MSSNISSKVSTHVLEAIKVIVPHFSDDFSLAAPTQKGHADLTTPIAMQLIKKYPELKSELGVTSPLGLAQEIVKKVVEHPHIESVEAVAPGFINVTFSAQAYLDQLNQWLVENKTFPLSEQKKEVVVEYSSPNIAKPFTIGHLRSTIIGDALARILASQGHTVYKDNHLGDWGTQFGKQIYALLNLGKGSKKENLAAIEASARPVEELVKLYVEFHQKAEQDPSLEDEGRAWFKKLEDGDAEARELWQLCIDWSFKEFDLIYQWLGVTFTENGGRGYGEAFFEDKMGGVIQELRDKKMMSSDKGAELVYFRDDKYPPLMILKQDGSTLYATRDLATDAFRLKHYGQDIVILNEVGAEQSLYFQQLYEVEKMLGWVKPGQRYHVKHGLYRFKDKKMSTRKGNVIWLEDVLKEAVEKVSVLAPDLDKETIQKVAIGAIKWHDLKKSSHLDIIFDWNEIVTLKGNAGPYVQYTVVRAQNILDKTVMTINDAFDIVRNNLIHVSKNTIDCEKDILISINNLFDCQKKAAEEYAPHHLCTGIYELAQSFNTFYTTAHVSSEKDEAIKAWRVLLTAAVVKLLKESLDMLGIETVTVM